MNDVMNFTDLSFISEAGNAVMSRAKTKGMGVGFMVVFFMMIFFILNGLLNNFRIP